MCIIDINSENYIFGRVSSRLLSYITHNKLMVSLSRLVSHGLTIFCVSITQSVLQPGVT